MSTKVRYASVIAVAVTFLTTLMSAGGSGASAENYQAAAIQRPAIQFTSQPVTQPLPVLQPAVETAVEPAESLTQREDVSASSDELSRELQCLAGAIYFEAKGESLEGQLAVGRVIVARSKSGRFPDSYCGVVYQRSQFSFIRGNRMPKIDKSSRNWTNAVRMARAAHEGSMKSPVEGALFFHAAHASPNWRLKRIARIDNHIFYR
jgi:N-acetylmuramoyl-L-alanine amidase